MKKLSCAILLILPLAFHMAHAETAQQSKMKTCNAEASGKKGDERKAFMKECLSKHDEKGSAAQQAQREKMKSCNAAAVDKKGDARKAFMKDCLSKH